jgi:hypothetical protein
VEIDLGQTPIDNHRVKHRDWYIDEGASNPLFGAIAAISGTLTNSIVTVNKYTKEVHQTVHKKPEEHTSPASTPDEEPFEWDLYKIPSRNPVTHAIQYPPQHLEMVAHRMASKTLPTCKDRVKWKKKHALSSAIANTPTTKSTASKTSKHEHNKLYEASAETGQMTLSLLSTGFKGILEFPFSFFTDIRSTRGILLPASQWIS